MIWFDVKEAREQLINNGIVISCRKRRKTFGKHKAYYRNFKGDRITIGEVMITPIDESWLFYEHEINDDGIDLYNPDHKKKLSQYVHNSGFNNVNEWIEAIRKINSNRKIPEYLMILQVVLL